MILGAFALAHCRRPSQGQPPEAFEAELEVGHSGCAAIVTNGEKVTCELAAPPRLRIVVPEGATEVTVLGDRGPIATERSDEAGAADRRRLAFEVPEGTTRVVVRAAVEGKKAGFALDVVRPPKIAWLEEARAARAKGKLADARAIAAPHAGEDPRAKSLLARITLAEGRAEEAFPLFREAITAHRKAGRISDAVDDSFALAFALHQRSHRYGEARAALDAIGDDLSRYPEGRAREPYYRGILASETGDARAALALLRESGERARLLGMAKLDRNARAALALELQAVGRVAESLGILEELSRDPDVKGCERVEILNDMGWGALLRAEAAGAEPKDARAAFDAASGHECSDAFLASSTLANVARLELDEGHAPKAREHLAAARALVKEPRGTERLAWLELDARIALASGDAKSALAKTDEARALARRFALIEAEWSSLAIRAEALEALGRSGDAATAALEAEELVDRMMLLVPLGAGRGAFASGRSRSARTAIDVLVKLSRFGDAARVARRSRVRVLASVERALRIERLSSAERGKWEAAVRAYRDARTTLDDDAAKDWALPSDELAKATEGRRQREQSAREALEAAIHLLATAAPALEDGAHAVGPGDLELLLHPGRASWWAIAVDERTVTAAPVAGIAGDVAVRVPALDALAPRLRDKKRLRVLPYGSWREYPIASYVLAGRPLLEHVQIDYPLGLDDPRQSDPAGLATAPAVVIGDPRSDLPKAREEATLVARMIGSRRRTVTKLGDEATSKAVAELATGAGLLHYAGHGVYAGVEGFESALPLSGKGLLSIGDLLSLAPAPRKVVLAGCDAARSAGAAEGLGLAQALVIAGADEVLAPTKPVSDAVVAKLAAYLYDGDHSDALVRLERGALSAAARVALVKLAKEDPQADWAAFRVIAR
ncbi:MAG: CHAT domain-containing protein [Deltaproteobacteria bacterium]|nr:CHAT domain-containing protein [Deltaproteobacteria bacterium]